MNRAIGWCLILCFLGLISSLRISEVLAQSDEDPVWGDDGDLADWVAEGERTDMSHGVFDDPGQGITFRMIARDSAPSGSLDSPADGRFSIRIMPSDTGGLVPIKCQPWFGIEYNEGDTCWVVSPRQAGFVRVPCAADVPPFYECWKSGEKVPMTDLGFCPSKPVFGTDDRCLMPNETGKSVEITGRAEDTKFLTRPPDETLITRPPATLLGHELSAETSADYIPFRGKIETAASGMSYSWSSMVNWSELISWTGTTDNEQVSYPSPPLGVNKWLSLARQSSVGPAEAIAELAAIITPTKYDLRVVGSVSLLAVNNGAPDRFAVAEADLAITVTAHEPVWAHVTNCDLFDPDDFYSQSVTDFSYSGGNCSFKFGQFIEPAKSDEGPDSEFECSVALKGNKTNILSDWVVFEIQHTMPGVTFFEQTDWFREVVGAEVALCNSPLFDPVCDETAGFAAENVANPIETDVTIISGKNRSIDGIQSITVISWDGRKEVFELDFDELKSSDDFWGNNDVAVEEIAEAIVENFILEDC